MAETPERLSKMPLSAPVWIWVLYGLLLATLGLLADIGQFFAVLFTAAFSFQFWTFACWRGLRRSTPAPRLGGEREGEGRADG